jgi:hypothetical protein
VTVYNGGMDGPYYGPGLPRRHGDAGWEFGMVVYLIFLGVPAALFVLGVGLMVVARLLAG